MSNFLNVNVRLKCFFVFVFTFLFFLIFTYVFLPTFCDEIWSYGFSYNISNGMVIYRDFNVLQTPLYFFIGSIFIKIFGNYLISMGIFNSILIGFIAVMLYKISGKKFLFLILVLSLFYPSGYNLFLVFLCFLIFYMIYNKKDNDIIIGLIVGLMFLTKQNIGIFMLVPYLFYSRNRLKSICIFLLPFLFFLIYLVVNDALFKFVDYAFLGLFSFQEKNTEIYLGMFIIEIIICVYLFYKLLKCRFKDKLVFYILAFQSISYPIFDTRHFVCSFFVFLCYYFIFENNYFLQIFLKGFKIAIIIVYVFHMFFNIFIDEFNIHTNHDLFYLKNDNESVFRLNVLKNYLEDLDFDLREDCYYFTEYYGYLFKLYYDIPVNKFDFLISGNMGYFTKDKLFFEIKNTCGSNRCIFFVDDSYDFKGNQWGETAYWIMEHYEKVDDLYTIDVYSNFID